MPISCQNDGPESGRYAIKTSLGEMTEWPIVRHWKCYPCIATITGIHCYYRLKRTLARLAKTPENPPKHPLAVVSDNRYFDPIALL